MSTSTQSNKKDIIKVLRGIIEHIESDHFQVLNGTVSLDDNKSEAQSSLNRYQQNIQIDLNLIQSQLDQGKKTFDKN